ncbi:MAG: toll/interleukin-1 receptor domain-containing protein [Clostridia bacterium]|nr:toll/interleukin-1 receptor domain-containing protein [Clostridia bacterium]
MNNLSLNRNIDVFISYSSKDEETANMVVDGLFSRGVQCWKAGEYTINSGEDFRQKIAEALDECKIFVIILSEHSMKSPWCKIELTEALRKNKKIYSLKIDETPIDELFDFKLGCSQTSDGTRNLIPVIENLAINVKRDRDALLEKEKSQIYSSASTCYFFDFLTLNKIALVLFLVLSIVRIYNLFVNFEEFYEISDMLMGCIVSIVFGFFMSGLYSFVYKGAIKKYADLGSPSAQYLAYKINNKLMASKAKKDKALNYLQKSADGKEYKALKKLAKILSKKGGNEKLQLKYKTDALEEKGKLIKKITENKTTIALGIVYLLLLVFIYVVIYYMPLFMFL